MADRCAAGISRVRIRKADCSAPSVAHDVDHIGVLDRRLNEDLRG
jgi:hypothetical protein